MEISGCDLSYASLFEKKDLEGRDLGGVRFVGAMLAGRDLTGADLSHARAGPQRYEARCRAILLGSRLGAGVG